MTCSTWGPEKKMHYNLDCLSFLWIIQRDPFGIQARSQVASVPSSILPHDCDPTFQGISEWWMGCLIGKPSNHIDFFQCEALNPIIWTNPSPITNFSLCSFALCSTAVLSHATVQQELFTFFFLSCPMSLSQFLTPRDAWTGPCSFLDTFVQKSFATCLLEWFRVTQLAFHG